MRERLYAEPETYIVHRYSKVSECRVPEKEPEYIEYIVSVVGKSVGVYDCVEVYGKQTKGNEENSLQRLGKDGVGCFLLSPQLGSDVGW